MRSQWQTHCLILEVSWHIFSRQLYSVQAGSAPLLSMDGDLVCRWDREQPPTVDNLVLLTFEEAEAHEWSHLTQVQQGDPQFFERVMSARKRMLSDLGISNIDIISAPSLT